MSLKGKQMKAVIMAAFHIVHFMALYEKCIVKTLMAGKQSFRSKDFEIFYTHSTVRKV